MTTILTFDVTSDTLANEFADITFKYVWLVKNDDNTYTVCFGDENSDTPEESISSTANTTLVKAIEKFNETVDFVLNGCMKSVTI